MTTTIHGKVYGKTIELDEDLGVADGKEVEIQVTMIKPKKTLPGPPPGWQSGETTTTAGLLADSWTEEDDRILDTNILSAHLRRASGLAHRFFQYFRNIYLSWQQPGIPTCG